jgi:nucleotide-binding universal stress UspA family protein
VLCVPPCQYAPPVRLTAIHRVLAATDFSECGNDAVRHAFSLVRAGDAVRLLHVNVIPRPAPDVYLGLTTSFPTEPLGAEDRRETEAKLEALVPAMLATGDIDISCEAIAAYDAAAAIRDAASRFGADVICIGTTGHSRARIALVGSTVQAVLAHAHIPVFAVTPPVK